METREREFQKQFINEAAPTTVKKDELHSVYEELTCGDFKFKNYFQLKTNVQTVLATDQEDDWIFNLNIGNVMQLQPINIEEMNLHTDNSHELSRDAMLEKIILLTVSYFCVGTELRFLSHCEEEKKFKM